MRSIVRSSFAWVGLSVALVPVAASAQAVAPAGYASSPSPTMMIGADGKPVAVRPVGAMASAPASARAAAPAPHQHKLKRLCASCMKKQEVMPVERIVACAHSKNGVCPTCQTLLAMPGTVTMGAPAAASAPGVEAPGRAVVSNSSAPSPRADMAATQFAAQSAPMSAVYDPAATPEPTPIGVMQANYATQPGTAPATGSSIPTASSLQPGHAMAASGGSPAPFQHRPTSSTNPKVISHLLGLSDIGAEWREQRANKKSQAHASIPYNSEGTTINELPASMVYGRQH